MLEWDIYDSKATYEKLFDWTDEHKFKTGKYSYKEAVIDELATEIGRASCRERV